VKAKEMKWQVSAMERVEARKGDDGTEGPLGAPEEIALRDGIAWMKGRLPPQQALRR